jgi:transitional endoplasmic reticulum ATPase
MSAIVFPATIPIGRELADFPIIKGPVSRLAAATGTLQNHIRFGRWRYYWGSYEYLLYEIEYQDQTRGMSVKLFFVLSPRSAYSTKEGRDSPTDQLLLAVGAWTTQLHDEIYVFDDGYWSKSHDLWKSVQGASWDEVILNRKYL